jgi:hypothetical protein
LRVDSNLQLVYNKEALVFQGISGAGLGLPGHPGLTAAANLLSLVHRGEWVFAPEWRWRLDLKELPSA